MKLLRLCWSENLNKEQVLWMLISEEILYDHVAFF